MSTAVRKIEKGKWLQNDVINGAPPSADAITNCLKTKLNNISIWEISDAPNIDDAVVAIVSKSDCLDTIDVVQIDIDKITSQGLVIIKTDGQTPLIDYIENHREIINLTYTSLGVLANLIIESLKNQTVKRYTRAMLIALMKNAVKNGRVKIEEINPKLASQISG